MLSIWYHSHQSLLLALYLQQEWGASRPKMSSRRAYRQNSLLFCASLCSAINSLAPHVHKCKNQNVCSKKKKHMSYINISINCFKVYIPTIHLLWTCLNTHYLYLKSSHPSQSSAPVAVPHQLQKSATSHHQRSCRGDHLLLWKKIHHHLRSIYPHVTYRFQEQKYRTSVVTGGLLFWRCFISFPQEISVMIFFSNGNRTKNESFSMVDESFSHQSQARMDA